MDLFEIFSGAITPGKWRALGAHLSARRVTGGSGVRVRRIGDQMLISSKRLRSSGSGSSSYTPWEPSFFTTGAEPSLVYKCRFNLGTLNDVCAANWDTDHTLPSDGSVRFVMLQVTTSSGKVTGLEIQLSSTAPASDTVLEGTPPPVWKILLGVVDKSSAKMIVSENLNASASEVFRQSRTTTTPGAEPFSRFWRWSHSNV